MPDWHTEQGHVHPDINSFILWAHGQYLTGDSGYAGVPLTIEHNTLLVDGKGQGNEGKGHDAWAGFPYSQMNQARITRAQLTPQGFELEGEGAAAYDASLGLKRYLRLIKLNAAGNRGERRGGEHNSPYLQRGPSFRLEDNANKKIRNIGQRSTAWRSISISCHPHSGFKIEQNVVMGPGRPGSVDKGSPERAGQRLVVSTPEKVTKTEFLWNLAF